VSAIDGVIAIVRTPAEGLASHERTGMLTMIRSWTFTGPHRAGSDRDSRR
jgi:hypothetical protein